MLALVNAADCPCSVPGNHIATFCVWYCRSTRWSSGGTTSLCRTTFSRLARSLKCKSWFRAFPHVSSQIRPLTQLMRRWCTAARHTSQMRSEDVHAARLNGITFSADRPETLCALELCYHPATPPACHVMYEQVLSKPAHRP